MASILFTTSPKISSTIPRASICQIKHTWSKLNYSWTLQTSQPIKWDRDSFARTTVLEHRQVAVLPLIHTVHVYIYNCACGIFISISCLALGIRQLLLKFNSKKITNTTYEKTTPHYGISLILRSSGLEYVCTTGVRHTLQSRPLVS